MITRSLTVFACHSAVCRPPGKNGGTGGSLPGISSTEVCRRFTSVGEVTPKLGIPTRYGGGGSGAEGRVAAGIGMLRVGRALAGTLNLDKDLNWGSQRDDPFNEIVHIITRSGSRLLPGICAGLAAERSTESSMSPDTLDVVGFNRAREVESAVLASVRTTYHLSQKERLRELSKVVEDTLGIPIEVLLAGEVMNSWRYSSTSQLSTMMQLSVAKTLAKERETAPLSTDIANISPENQWLRQSFVDKVVRQVYKTTQSDLKRAGVEEVTLMRGVSRDDYGIDRRGDVQANVQLRPLSSWTVNHESARDFGRDTIVLKVKRADIFALSTLGVGALDENEVLLVGGTYPALVTTTGEATQRKYVDA